MELCLGTVQFGMDYGIRGQKQPCVDDAVQMLDYATQNGITTIDTANAYGTAEDVIGLFLQKKSVPREQLFLISKLKPNLLDDCDVSEYYQIMRENIENSLSRLHTDYLDSYLLHSSRYVFNEAIIDTLNRLKKEGYAKKVGVSVYEPDEAIKCIEHPNVDFMQLPYSIFDQRMKSSGIFEKAANSSIQIHSRSAFIQGLILMQEKEVPDFLNGARPILQRIDELCEKYEISRVSLALNFVKQQKRISHLVFGVDNIKQLEENISFFRQDLPKELVRDIATEFVDIETNIVMPSLWKR